MMRHFIFKGDAQKFHNRLHTYKVLRSYLHVITNFPWLQNLFFRKLGSTVGELLRRDPLIPSAFRVF
jgi:hypothetical protein